MLQDEIEMMWDKQMRSAWDFETYKSSGPK